MTSDTGRSSFYQAEVLQAPTQPNDVVRQADLTTAIAGTAPISHTHPAAQITDFQDQVRVRLAADLEDSDTVSWAAGARLERRSNAKGVCD
jgi:hypothetical protein